MDTADTTFVSTTKKLTQLELTLTELRRSFELGLLDLEQRIQLLSSEEPVSTKKQLSRIQRLATIVDAEFVWQRENRLVEDEFFKNQPEVILDLIT